MKKLLLFLCFCLYFVSSWAQTRTITGRVTAEDDGSPLPGVNVVLRGTVSGTVTDANGNYSISVPANTNTITFSFVGMVTQSQDINDRAIIDVKLQSDSQQLQEVVVNAIGETVSKDKLGIASSTVGGMAVTQSGEVGLINGLAGKAAGVVITRNGGDPGAGSYIQLRGQSTITGDLQPLIVIDGMPMFNSNVNATGGVNSGSGNVGSVQQQSRLNDLNPADIESMEIIKSAAGAALWGSRAANGVIVITTKKGKNSKGKLNLTYAGTLSFDQINKMPAMQTTFGQGTNGHFQSTGTGNNLSFGDQIATRSGGPDTYINPGAFVVFPDGSRRYNIANGTSVDTNPHGGKNSQQIYDHTKDAFQTGHSVDHNISLSSGNDKTQFYVSYENLQQEGIIKMNSNYMKNVGRVNLTTEITPKLHATVNADYNNVRSNRIQQGSNTSGLLLGMLRSPSDFDNTQYIGDYHPSETGLVSPGRQVSFRNPIGAGNAGYDNPYWTINKNRSFSVVNRFIGNFELVYDAYDWLSLRGNTGIDTYTDRRTDYLAPGSSNALTGFYEEQYVQESQFNTNLYANAHKTFSNNFSGNILLGFNYNNRQYNNVGANGTNFIVPEAPPNLTNIPPANRVAYNVAQTVRTSAGFFQINTDLLQQVSVSLTGRAETSSTFGPQANSLFFYPSATASWQFTKMTGSGSVLSFGKLRASYGVVGKQPAPYQNLTQYGSQAYFDPFGGALQAANYGIGGYAISTVAGNPSIRPEKKHEVEVGTDLRFLNDRFLFGATVYYNKTTDAILQSQLAPTSGFSNYVANAGVIENKGIELTLTAPWIKNTDGFSWSSNFIWSAYRNKVLDLAGAQYVFLSGFADGSSVATKGLPLGTLWGTYWQKNADGSLFTDANGFPYINSQTGPIGNPNPNYIASFGNTFSYKNLSLYVLFDASVGGQMWNGTLGAMTNFGTNLGTATLTTLSAADAAATKTYDGNTVATSGRSIKNTDGSYTFRGTVKNFGEGNVALDQAYYQGVGNGFNVNQPFVEDATWTRLREVTLSYNLNSEGFRRATKLQSATFSLTGRNLLLWTPYQGIDPDTNLTGSSNGRGIDYFQNPNTRSILFKLTVTF